MHHLTNYYKHMCEQLQDRVNYLEKIIKEAMEPSEEEARQMMADYSEFKWGVLNQMGRPGFVAPTPEQESAYGKLKPYFVGTIEHEGVPHHVFNFSSLSAPGSSFQKTLRAFNPAEIRAVPFGTGKPGITENDLFIRTGAAGRMAQPNETSHAYWKFHNERENGISLLINGNTHEYAYWHAQHPDPNQLHRSFVRGLNESPKRAEGEALAQKMDALFNNPQA